MDRRGSIFYPDTEESDRRCHKKKRCHKDLQYTRKKWNGENCQDPEKCVLENLSKQESDGKIWHEFLTGFHSKGEELRKANRGKASVLNYDGWMRDQGWVRNFDGFWERRDGRYWEKMQYYEKYREWEMELTEEREKHKGLERGCECKAKSREKDWNRYERGYDSNEMKLPTKPSINRRFSSRGKELPNFKKLPSVLNMGSRPSKKRSLFAVRSSDIVKCDDGISSQFSSSLKISKLSKIERISTDENSNTKKKIAHSYPNVIRKVYKDSKPKTDQGGRGTPAVGNVLELENPPKLSTDKCVHSQRTKTCGCGSKPDIGDRKTGSLNSRFTNLCQNSETSFAEVNMMNMEITIVNDSDKATHERKETPICKDSLELNRMKCLKNKDINRMKCLKNKDIFIPTDNFEESLPTDEGKETTESSAENDDSSKESDTDDEESNDAMESSKRPQEVLNSNSFLEDSNAVPGGEEFDQQNCQEQRNDNLYVTEKDLSLNSKEKIDTDMIDLNVSQDLFKTTPSGNITEEKQMSRAESDIVDQDEETSYVKNLEQNVLSIEQQIAELRAKL